MILLDSIIMLRTWIGCLIGYAFYGLGGVVYFSIILPTSFLFIPFGKLQYNFISSSLRFYCILLTRYFLPLMQVYTIRNISGFKNNQSESPVIYVANHQGKLDGPFLLGLLNNTAAVMKLKYALSPVYASLVKNLNFITLNQHSREVLEKALNDAGNVFKNGKNLLIFPEGTRSTTKRLKPFKNFAFKIAIQNDIPIVPIVIHSKFPFMAKKLSSFFPNQKNSYTIRCLKAILQLSGESPADLADRVQKIMSRELKTITSNQQKHISKAQFVELAIPKNNS